MKDGKLIELKEGKCIRKKEGDREVINCIQKSLWKWTKTRRKE